jgi:hypothetical protein
MSLKTTMDEVQQPDGDQFLHQLQKPLELRYMYVRVCVLYAV